jgi:hypothetical protein
MDGGGLSMGFGNAIEGEGSVQNVGCDKVVLSQAER